MNRHIYDIASTQQKYAVKQTQLCNWFMNTKPLLPHLQVILNLSYQDCPDSAVTDAEFEQFCCQRTFTCLMKHTCCFMVGNNFSIIRSVKLSSVSPSISCSTQNCIKSLKNITIFIIQTQLLLQNLLLLNLNNFLFRAWATGRPLHWQVEAGCSFKKLGKVKIANQGFHRFSVAKFPDFSSHGMTISLTLLKQLPYRTNVINGIK